MNKNPRSGLRFYLAMLLIAGIMVYISSYIQSMSAYNYTENEFVTDLKGGTVKSITVAPNQEVPTGKITVVFENGEQISFYTTDVDKVIAYAEEFSPATERHVKEVAKPGFLETVLPYVVMGGIIILFMNMFMMQMNGSNAKMANFGKSRAKMHREKKVTFANVAGLYEEKEELREIVDFLKAPAKFIEVGARIPKGVLLVGPPGTGKTLLAKAVAGEADVPFFSISGSDFVEMFVGVGASRVRDLFEEGKKNAPCIIFIDEIDAVGRRRGSGLGGGHDEREQTLNQLLVEMDGFGVNEGIIVVAATNRVDILDPAILRPGRFDRKVMVGRPDVKGREEILQVHVKGKPLGDDVDLAQIARTTAGFSGADLENLMNESAIYAAREDRKFIRQSDVDKAFIKVGIGTEKKSRVVPEKDRRITAYHEAGHAILFYVMPDLEPVYTISIIPTGVGAAGYTMPLPENDNMHLTRGKMIQQIKVALAGRVAEAIIFDDITTGASQDIKVATGTARSMVMEYGMSDKLGMIYYGDDGGDEVFLGRDLGHARSYGENVATLIDQEVKGIIDECYEDTKRILLENMDVLHKCAALLLEKERIDRTEFEELFAAKTLEEA